MDINQDKAIRRTLEELINAVLEFESKENENAGRLMRRPDLTTNIWQDSARKLTPHAAANPLSYL